MKKLLAVFVLCFTISVFAQQQPQQQPQQLTKEQKALVDEAQPLQEQLKTLKASMYDYNRLIKETEEQIDGITKQLATLQQKFDALPKEEPKNNDKQK